MKNVKMRIKHFLIFALVIAAVTVMLCGCGSSELDLEGTVNEAIRIIRSRIAEA